mmetsp:Transcript_56261/g.127172  ORF Transcript_56261/g.127172 Transcript_56261/m.127172 type:complete len:203 (+) Transcript_56261:1492-2100(+)
MGNARGNARGNTRSNARGNARSNARGNTRGNTRSNAGDSARANTKGGYRRRTRGTRRSARGKAGGVAWSSTKDNSRDCAQVATKAGIGLGRIIGPNGNHWHLGLWAPGGCRIVTTRCIRYNTWKICLVTFLPKLTARLLGQNRSWWIHRLEARICDTRGTWDRSRSRALGCKAELAIHCCKICVGSPGDGSRPLRGHRASGK